MKHTFSSTVGVACLIERRACAIRFRNNMGEGKISTEVIALILARSDKPIFRNTGFAGAQSRNFAFLATNELAHAGEPGKHVNQNRFFHRSSTLKEGTFSV